MIRAAAIALLAAAIGLASPALADPSPQIRHEQMIYPVVLVQSGAGSGSGTVIFSEQHDGEVHTYILTNNHVIKNSVNVTKVWCSGPPQCDEPAKIDVERRDSVRAQWFDYNELSRSIGMRSQKADIIAYSKLYDLALLRTRNKETPVKYVAALIPEDAPIYLGDEVKCVGAGLGNPPFITSGEVSFLDAEIKGEDSTYTTMSCQLIFGNSGGAAFRWSDERRQFELVGVPAKVSATWATGPVTHMAWAISMETVRAFLVEHELGWIVGIEPEPDDDDEGDDNEMDN
jgi:S1-C subfamily serine protease